MPALTRLSRATLAIAALLCFALWAPVAVVAYVPGWHEASCDWHDHCDRFGRAQSLTCIGELRAFLQHRGELANAGWSAKEKAHLAEVRGMLDRWAILAALSLLVWAHADARERLRAARWTLLGIASCVIVLPFFGTFWREVFHPLLFDNRNWLNNPSDVSWWIMPRLYFQYTTGLVIGVAVMIAALARLAADPRRA